MHPITSRTGVGKSSTLLTLFRGILIDSMDILKLGLKDLRPKSGIISQTPLVLEGTVLSNLDPFYEYTDDQLMCADAKVPATAKILARGNF